MKNSQSTFSVIRLSDGSPLKVRLTFKNIKRMYLRVQQDGSLNVSVPFHTSQKTIDNLIYAHEGWIKTHVAKQARNFQRQVPSLVEGTTLNKFDTPLTIQITYTKKLARTRSIYECGGYLIFELCDFDAHKTPDEIDKLLITLYEPWKRETVRKTAVVTLDTYASLMHVWYSEFVIKTLKSRWGSCNVKTHRICINAELINYPLMALEAVCVHELCHLLEPSHNAHFHELLDRYYPQNKEARDLLKTIS